MSSASNAAKKLGYRHGRMGANPIKLIKHQRSYDAGYKKGEDDAVEFDNYRLSKTQ